MEGRVPETRPPHIILFCFPFLEGLLLLVSCPKFQDKDTEGIERLLAVGYVAGPELLRNL